MNKNVMSFQAAAAGSDTAALPSQSSAGSGSGSGTGALAGAPADERGSGTSEQRRRELADFLRTRREKLKPDQVGIVQGSRRRTPGLRREEVAELAGVGTTWYTWLEQARDIQPSGEVLRRLGHALQLNPAELRHMFALAGKAPPVDMDPSGESVSDSMRRVLETALVVPAFLLGSRWDILAVNEKAYEAFPQIRALPDAHRNWLYFVFVDQLSRNRVVAWEAAARRLIAEFRASVGDSLDSPWVTELVDLLKAESQEFALWWREHDVRDNATASVELVDENNKKTLYERTIFRSMENPRYKFLLFTPMV